MKPGRVSRDADEGEHGEEPQETIDQHARQTFGAFSGLKTRQHPGFEKIPPEQGRHWEHADEKRQDSDAERFPERNRDADRTNEKMPSGQAEPHGGKVRQDSEQDQTNVFRSVPDVFENSVLKHGTNEKREQGS